jgi:hypothetical protein
VEFKPFAFFLPFRSSCASCLLLGLATLTACARRGGEIVVALEAPAPAPAPAAVRVSGLSSDELSAIASAGWTTEAWQSFIAVRVASGPADAPPVAGRYAIAGGDVVFQPSFGFDPGRAYRVDVNTASLPRPRDASPISTVVSLPAEVRAPTARVERVWPSGAWPQNLLRFYIEFSAPMSRTSGLGHIRLVDDSGEAVVDPFLPLEVDFWNQDATRYTVFFDPGRVKTDILPNREMGRALEAGRTYTLEVSAAWLDAHGQPLVESFRREIRIGASDEQPIDPARWTIAAPAPGSREPLVVRFGEPLDHGLLARAVGVRRAAGGEVAGEVTIGDAETEWRLAPVEPWHAGAYELIVLPILEDAAGNRIGRPFELAPSAPHADEQPKTARGRIRRTAPGTSWSSARPARLRGSARAPS